MTNKGLGIAYVLSHATHIYFVPRNLIFKKGNEIVESCQLFKIPYKQFVECLEDLVWTTWELQVYVNGIPYIIMGDDTTFIHISLEEKNNPLSGYSMNCLSYLPKGHDYWNCTGNEIINKIVYAVADRIQKCG